MHIKLDHAFTHTLNSLPRGRLYTRPITNTCKVPSYHATIDRNANVLLCDCEAWLPIPVGQVDGFDSLDSIWNSDAATFLQKNINDKKFTWCAIEHCGILNHSIIPKIYSLNLSLDDSCNLACPSCRREQRMLEQGNVFDQKLAQTLKIKSWLEKFDRPIHITMSGDGDPLASKIMRPLILDFQPKPTQTFTLKTNGLLMKKILDSSKLKPAISCYSISVDAGTESVYEKVRRPGRWVVLIENLDWLASARQTAQVVLNFVVQRDNFRDLYAFRDLCQAYKFTGTIMPLFDWGTWNRNEVLNPDAYTIANGTFVDHNVTNPDHPDHKEFVGVINDLKHTMTFSPYFTKFFDATR